MARINPSALGDADHSAIVSMSSIGVLLCMIVSLVGIKLWWFKHRLTFDQSSTQNGAAGGSRATVQGGSRLSQQFSEPGVGHGIFRKREENEVDILSANMYPPVRIPKPSESTPSLILPQKSRRRNEVRNAAIDSMQPPAREPPRPPAGELQIMAIQEVVLQKERLSINLGPSSVSENEEQVEVRPKPPKRGNRNSSGINEGSSFTRKFLKTKSVVETDVQDKLKNENRQTGYIRYEEVDIEGLEDVRERAAFPDDFEIKPTNDLFVDKPQKSSDRRHLQLRIDDKNNEMSRLETPTTFIRNYDITVQEFLLKNQKDESRTATRDVWSGHNTSDQFMTSIAPSPSEFPVKDSPLWEVPVDKDKKTTVSTEFHAGYDENWDVLDTQNRFSTNLRSEVEAEFNKIQRSYKEARSELQDESAEASPVTVHNEYPYKPKGFGQNIDDDWESFEALENESTSLEEISSDMQETEGVAKNGTLKELEHKDDEIIKTNENPSTKESSVARKVVFDFDDNCEEKSSSTNLRHATGYIEDSSALHEELQCDGNNGKQDKTAADRISVRFDVPNSETSMYSLTKRRPTGFPRNVDSSDEALDYDDGSPKEIDVPDSETSMYSLAKRRPTGFPRNVDSSDEALDYDDGSPKEIDVPDSETSMYSLAKRRPTGFLRNVDSSDEALNYDDGSPKEIDVPDSETSTYSLAKRRPTGFLRNVDSSDEALNYDDGSPKEIFDLKDGVECENIGSSTDTSALKQRSDLIESESDNVNSAAKSAKGLKAKPRHKVTFDFNTQEHYPTDEYQTIDSEDDTGTARHIFPTPMKRLTKTDYNYEEAAPAPGPLLFSSQVSMDDDTDFERIDASGSSWTAIRQHRMLAQEFRHISLSTREEIVLPASRKPTPAYRNPIAQMVAETTVHVEDEESIMQATYMCDLPANIPKQLNFTENRTTDV